MDGAIDSSDRDDARAAGPVLRTAQVAARDPEAAAGIAEALGPGPFALICLFVSPEAAFGPLMKRIEERYPHAQIMACTTAGEIGRAGYETGQIVAAGFGEADFRVQLVKIPDLGGVKDQPLIDKVIQTRLALGAAAPKGWSEFAFLMVDGLSLAEERLASLLATGLGSMPLFGGSSGDGARFSETRLYFDGAERRNAAVAALIRSRAQVKVFTLDHLQPTDTRMVVTGARPEERIVTEINAEPAAQEYARLLGKDPHQLDPFTFAAHPVVVRLGDSHHVRAIQRVNDAGELVFFSAINEGMVLTLADHDDIAAHLDARLGDMQEDFAPVQILACDCILRRIEAEQSQKARTISDILRRHNVTGFSTYGEQVGAMHVNQTLTGVAFYPAGSGR
ncbi:FIST C-terminal domain-containing protein [Roseivivax sp. GX 12232]|uniref:FIST N-terminal domain-containing protein n=1 Tax=Roseivivax sp. GX 12232 TaxID=2900547 RepID=UPI001E466C9C|nr:FIST N-terminal domain-containing protein [Roseivivax sp. GX 12232]MCE0504719.1 FIST C-terminal domain-containing protein [Roseivivax sp. GX 12232]